MIKLTTKMIDIDLDDHVLPLVVPDDLPEGEVVTENTEIPEESEEFGVTAYVFDDVSAANSALELLLQELENTWFVPVVLKNGNVIVNRITFGQTCETKVELDDKRTLRKSLEVDPRFVSFNTDEEEEARDPIQDLADKCNRVIMA